MRLSKPSSPSTTRLAAFLLGMAGAASAFAGCEVTESEAVIFPALKVIGSRPPGTVLATTHAKLITLCTTIGHQHSGARGFYLKAANYANNMRPVRLPDGSHAWTTSIPGIGLRITGGHRNESISKLAPGEVIAFRVTDPHKGHALWTDTFKYEVVVTDSKIGSGTISGGLWDIYWHDIGINSGGTMQGVSRVSTSVTVPPRSTSCGVNTASRAQAVSLGTVSVPDLQVGGKSSPASFSVDLTCTGGEAGAPPRRSGDHVHRRRESGQPEFRAGTRQDVHGAGRGRSVEEEGRRSHYPGSGRGHPGKPRAMDRRHDKERLRVHSHDGEYRSHGWHVRQGRQPERRRHVHHELPVGKRQVHQCRPGSDNRFSNSRCTIDNPVLSTQ